MITRRLAVLALLLSLTGCGVDETASSQSPVDSSEQTVGAGCAADDAKVALTASPVWQLCLPAAVVAELAFSEGSAFSATATVDGQTFEVAKYKFVNDADFAALESAVWLELGKANGMHLMIDRSFELPADVTPTQLSEVSRIFNLLGDQSRYSSDT